MKPGKKSPLAKRQRDDEKTFHRSSTKPKKKQKLTEYEQVALDKRNIAQLMNGAVILIDGLYSFECPHCHLLITVDINEVNCQIFRHGVRITANSEWGFDGDNYTNQMDPHTSEQECMKLRSHARPDYRRSMYAQLGIYGCGLPFRLVKQPNETYSVVKCGYI